MDRKNALRIYSIISAVLVIVFAVKNGIDYLQYSPVNNSAPLGTWILVNAVCFLVPAAAVFILGIIIRERANKKGYAG